MTSDGDDDDDDVARVGADPNCADNRGMTPLHAAAMRGAVEIVDMLCGCKVVNN